LDA
jgi:hypothetical protein